MNLKMPIKVGKLTDFMLDNTIGQKLTIFTYNERESAVNIFECSDGIVQLIL